MLEGLLPLKEPCCTCVTYQNCKKASMNTKRSPLQDLLLQVQTALPFRRRPSSGNIPDPYFQGGGYIPPTTPPPPLTGNSPHEGPQTHPDRAHSNLGSQTPVPRIPVTYEYDESFNPASTVASEIPESMLSTDHGRGSRPSRWYSLEAPFKFQSQAFSEGDSLYADQQTALAARPYTTAMRLAVGGEVDGAVDVPLLDCTNYPGEEEYPGVCVEGFQGRAGMEPSVVSTDHHRSQTCSTENPKATPYDSEFLRR